MMSNKLYVVAIDGQIIEHSDGFEVTVGLIPDTKFEDGKFFISSKPKYYFGAGLTIGEAINCLYTNSHNTSKACPIQDYGFNHIFVYVKDDVNNGGEFWLPNPFMDFGPDDPKKMKYLSTIPRSDVGYFVDHPLAPLYRANVVHPEIRDLDEIENFHDGIVLAKYTKDLDMTKGELHTIYNIEFEKMNSDYVKSAIKEEIANNPNLDKIRIYREVGTLFKEDGDFDQLNDYTIPDEELEYRNGNPNFPNIDKYGKYITGGGLNNESKT